MQAGYEAAWASIRVRKQFTLQDVLCDISKTYGDNVNADTIKSYIQRLVRGGYAEAAGYVKTPTARVMQYALIKDVGNEAPRLRKDGQRSRHGRNRENMWRSMRMLNHFNYRELALTASTDGVKVTEADAKDYLKDLYRAGYLRAVKPGDKTTGCAIYRLIKNTGPKPPVVRKISHVYDPNLKQVVWPQELTHVDQ